MSEHRVAASRCVHIPNGIISMSDHVKLPVPIGPYHGWDWHNFLGPSFCGKSGDILKQQPGERHPVWRIFEKWLAAGKLVDGSGYAVLTAAPASGS